MVDVAPGPALVAMLVILATGLSHAASKRHQATSRKRQQQTHPAPTPQEGHLSATRL
jgi:hypothetical protein